MTKLYIGLNLKSKWQSNLRVIQISLYKQEQLRFSLFRVNLRNPLLRYLE
jgi:hypothetical protein